MATFHCYTCTTVALLPASCRVARVIQLLSFSLLANMLRLPLKCTLLLRGVCFHLTDMAGGLLPAALGLASHLLVTQDLNQPRGRSGAFINAVLSASSHQLSSDPA